MAIFLTFQNGEKTIFPGEPVAQRWGPIVAEQALKESKKANSPQLKRSPAV